MNSVSLKAKKEDLRRLMKERRENLKDKNKIESPFAKYNSIGQLYCTLCNIQIKNSGLWASHVLGKIHKENALKKRKGSTDLNSSNSPKVDAKHLEVQPPPAKKIKVESQELPKIQEVSKIESAPNPAKISLLGAYSSSSSEDEEDALPPEPTSTCKSNNELPADFFDAAASTSFTPDVEKSETEAIQTKISSNDPAEALPEGFFDDPVLDAKARNIEYKDPIEEEWERYQKAIAEETNVSKSIIEENLEESILEQGISQIDEQIQQWERVKNLQSLAEDVKSKVSLKDENANSSGSTDDELEEDDLLDWRSKSVKR